LRDFDFDKFIRDKLLVCGLSPNALISMDADKNNFADMQLARKSYQKLDEELKGFRRRLIRHNARYQRYGRLITEKVASLDDDDYYFSVLKPKSKRMMILSDKYTAIAVKILEFEDKVDGIIYNLDQYQRSYYTKIFASRLRKARKAAGLTQAELATQIGMKRSSYGLYEQARNEPNVSLLAILSHELKRSPNWFLGL
ncbi:MAG: helix-turn-helix transcriptional regulator, partial [Selenomonadaceae bacterium]|nr:helix-turn-helix transcriptional regulator [Selenomonadaceae bacterium]